MVDGRQTPKGGRRHLSEENEERETAKVEVLGAFIGVFTLQQQEISVDIVTTFYCK